MEAAKAGKGDGGKGKGKNKGGDYFEGWCNHCGKYGHKKQQCRTLDREMAEKGKGKGKGKGLYSTEKGEEQEGGQDDDDKAGMEWWMGEEKSIYILQKNPGPQYCSPNPYAALAEEDFPELLPPASPVPTPPRPTQPRTPSLGGTKARKWTSMSRFTRECECEGCAFEDDCWMHPPARTSTAHGQDGGSGGGLGVPSRSVCVGGRAEDRHVHCLLRGEPEGQKQILETRKEDKPKGSRKGGYKLVEAVVDSGCEESVTDPDTFPELLIPSAMSKAGKGYKGPDNSPIPNLGQKQVSFMTDEGHQCGIPFQCAKVAHPLISVTQLAEVGNDTYLQKKGGYIENQHTKKRIQLVRKRGLYFLRMWVRIPEKGPEAGFTRPA